MKAFLRYLTGITLSTFWLSGAVSSLAAAPIKLGLNYPSTGPYKVQGIAQAQGAQMAIDEINAAGGVLGRSLEMVTANTASKPDKAVANVKKMAGQGVDMLFGGSSSAVAIAAGKEAANHNLIYFGTLTYANEVTDEEAHKYMFRESYNAWMAAKALSFYLNQSLAGKKLFYVTADYSWGHSTEASLRKFTNTEDPYIHGSVKVPFPRPRPADIDYALQQANASGADVLILIQFGEDMAAALAQSFRLGLKDKMQIVVPNLTLGMAKSAGAAALHNVIGAVPWSWKVPELYGHEKGQEFVESFRRLYRQNPSSSAASAYNIVYQYKEAVERANSTDTARVIKALEGHRYSGIKDPQQWRDFDHQNIQSVYVVKGKARADVLKDEYHEDYFEILLNIPGNTAAKTYDEWKETRQAAGKPLVLGKP